VEVTVYTRPGCQPCRASKRKLDSLGVEYTEVDILQDPESRDYILSLGHKAAPVVTVFTGSAGLHHWSGYKPERLEALAHTD